MRIFFKADRFFYEAKIFYFGNDKFYFVRKQQEIGERSVGHFSRIPGNITY